MEPLEPSANIAVPKGDQRPLIPEPLPVKLVAIEDVRLPAPAGRETELDAFYVGMWGFERDEKESGAVYRAENYRLRFDVAEPPISRDELRPVTIEVQSLREAERKIIEAELEYERQRGLTAGSDVLLLLDPAGNWVAFVEAKAIM